MSFEKNATNLQVKISNITVYQEYKIAFYCFSFVICYLFKNTM